MPTITIDGKDIEFQQGQTIIEAAKDVGIDIPHFCWHPELSVSGNCRVCLVEVEKMPKLVIACATMAADGMVVHTQSERALGARNAVMEFILINHPLDCPICDEAGECKLQDYAYQHSLGESRFVEEKVHKIKRFEIGPRVMFDGERCISCSRCIRFCDEIAGVKEITFVKRGDNVTIRPFPGKTMGNPYSMNTIDICPVGALTSKDFRFEARVWDMSSTQTICTGCSRGCNIDMWVRSNEIKRLTPRLNEEVNSHWMCDDGRLNTWKHINAETRVNGPHVRRDGQLVSVEWSEAFSAAASEVKVFNGNEIACIASGYATTEDNYVFAKFAANVIGTHNLDKPRHIDNEFEDKLLRRADRTPNSAGAELAGVKPGPKGKEFNSIMKAVAAGEIKALFVIEEDLAAMSSDYAEALKKLDLLIVHATNFNATTELANIVFPAASYAEKNGTWVNFQGRLQRIRPAVTTAEMDRSLEGMSVSRLDAFGTRFDRWGNVRKVDARSTWKIIAGIANSLGKPMKYTMAEEVFEDMAKHIDALSGLDYDDIGEQGKALKLEEQKV